MALKSDLTSEQKKQAAEALNKSIDWQAARVMLTTEIPRMKQGGVPEPCVERMREILQRRTNGGEFTHKDAEFFATWKNAEKANDKAALQKLCEQSGNTLGGTIGGVTFFVATITAIILKNTVWAK